MDSPRLAVHAERCLQVRHKNAECLRCTDVCTTGALSRGEEGFIVAPEKCIGCGTCASVCPTCCLEAKNPTDEALTNAVAHAAKQGEGRVALACEQAVVIATAGQDGAASLAAGGAPVVQVVCLGRADESLIVEAAARGVQSISLIHGACETCAHASGGKLCEEICQSAQSLLDAAASPLKLARVAAKDIAWTTTLNSEAGAPSEQSAAPVRATTTQEEPVFAHVQKDGTLPHVVPPRRLRLYNSLKRMHASATPEITTRLWGQVTINTELCRSCRMCTVFCPTGALSRYTAKDGGFGVEHRSTLCVQCRLCETICPEQAITLANTVSLAEFMSGEKFRFEMQPLGWEPGTNAMVARTSRFMHTAAIQDPQASVKVDKLTQQRAYALEREARREEIRRELSTE